MNEELNEPESPGAIIDHFCGVMECEGQAEFVVHNQTTGELFLCPVCHHAYQLGLEEGRREAAPPQHFL